MIWFVSGLWICCPASLWHLSIQSSMEQDLSVRESGMNFAAFAAYAWVYPNNFEILHF